MVASPEVEKNTLSRGIGMDRCVCVGVFSILPLRETLLSFKAEEPDVVAETNESKKASKAAKKAAKAKEAEAAKAEQAAAASTEAETVAEEAKAEAAVALILSSTLLPVW